MKQNSEVIMATLAFVDIDTQKDFMVSSGALYVPGAESIIPKLRELTEIAKKHKIKILGSVDRHFGDEAHKENEKELKRWGGPFPDHCMDGSDGQKKIPETSVKKTAYIENRPYDEKELEKIIKKHDAIILEKQTYNVFSNVNAEKVFSFANSYVVYGVATDYCVKAAVLELLKRKKKVYLVVDAIKEVAQETGKNALKEMEDLGAIKVDTNWIRENIQKLLK
ncbi:MAG: isochorismatase family protein [Candidatus Korarchaeota archaeon]